MSSKRKIILAATVIGIGSAVFVGLVLYPIFQGVANDHDEILAQKRELARIIADRENIKNFEELSSRYQTEFVILDTLLVDLENPIAFFKFLDDTSNSSRVTLEKKPGTPRKLKGDVWASLDVQLSGVGSYANVVHFLKKLENSPFLVEPQKVSITLPELGTLVEEEQIPGNVKFTLLLKVFTK